MAIGLAHSFNEQHRLGLDLNNNLGGDFFRDLDSVSPQSLSHSGNTGDGVLDVTITDVATLSYSDYQLDFDGVNYTLTRLDDNNVTSFAAAALPATVDGFTLSLASGTVNAGDSYLLQPTRLGARDIALAITRTEQVAMASPIKSEASFNNLGNGEISAVTITNVNSLPFGSGVMQLTYDETVPGFTLNIGPPPPGPLAYDPAVDSNGKSFTLGAPFDGITFSISGTPEDGDIFTLSDNNNGIGDNANGLSLAALQINGVFENGTASFEDAYGQMVVDVGSVSRQATINRNAQETLLEQAQSTRDEISGVNLDEEAANLMRYQQAYQASARTIQVSNTLFDALISAVGG